MSGEIFYFLSPKNVPSHPYSDLLQFLTILKLTPSQGFLILTIPGAILQLMPSKGFLILTKPGAILNLKYCKKIFEGKVAYYKD